MSDTPRTDAMLKDVYDEGIGIEYEADAITEFVRTLERELEELERQLAEAQKDAERYRALFVVPRSVRMPLILPNHPNNVPVVTIGYDSKAGADRDIDAAIAAKGGKDE